MSNDTVMYIDYEVTVLDRVVEDVIGSVRPTPDNAFHGGIGVLLNRISPRFRSEGVLVLGPLAARALGLPDGTDPESGPEIVVELARHGWTCNRWSDWSTCYGENRPKIHVLDMRRVNRANFPLWSADPMQLVTRLRLWHDLTGYAWRMSPGASGLAIMAGLDSDRARKGQAKTTWKLADNNGDGPADAHEDDFRKEHWSRRPERSLPYVHGFDSVRSYIAAAMLCEVSPWALKHTGRQAFDKRRAGWWQVELSGWAVSEMPDPAGYVMLRGADDPRRIVRWLTTPTVTLLEELTVLGVYGGVRILDSWTGPARPYPLRAYAQRMDDVMHLGMRDGRQVRPLRYPMVDNDDLSAVLSATKIVGHKTFGALDAPSNWAHRPHMWHSVVALARANLWRKAWQIGQHTGHWPLWIEVDSLFYGSVTDDPGATATLLQYSTPTGRKGILLDPSGLQLGQFRPKALKRLRRPVDAA